MSQTSIDVLIVESDAPTSALLRQVLAVTADPPFRVAIADTLKVALTRLRKHRPAVILLDLTLRDAQGMAAFEPVHAAVPTVPILLMCGPDEEEAAHSALRAGAQDYFGKSHMDAHWLPRALRYHLERQAVQARLVASEARFRQMSDCLPVGVFVSDPQGACEYTNAAYRRMASQNGEPGGGNHWYLGIDPEDQQRVRTEWERSIHDKTWFETEARMVRKGGSVSWVQINGALLDVASPPFGCIHVFGDITARKSIEQALHIAEEALFEEKERAEVTLNSIGDAVLATDMQGNVTYMNMAATRMTGWPLSEAMGRPLPDIFRIFNADTREKIPSPAVLAIQQNQVVGLASNSILINRQGVELALEDSAAPIHNHDGKVSGAVMVFHDVSESRAMTRKMAHLALHDGLTGLPNRLLLADRLSGVIGIARRHHRHLALIFIDLDAFKQINDSLGHEIGDLLLQSVSERLCACVRDTDTVCRQGGDEFVILLSEIERPMDAERVANTILKSFSVPHIVLDNELFMTLSMGISIYPEDGTTPEMLLQHADMAMYHAKACGRNNYQFFKAGMNDLAICRRQLESRLQRALKRQEFELYYQPKINLFTGDMESAEALIRWKDPTVGQVLPAKFIHIAEESGLIVEIGQWVLREVCRQIRSWIDVGSRPVPVAINVSAVEFRHPRFLACVAQIIEETGVPATLLEFELTESILMQDETSSLAILNQLKDMGIQLAIDNFGTGYSSLGYLKHFPIDSLKIDQSFVRDIISDEDCATIVSSVIRLGLQLKKHVIAKGVETEAQRAFLQSQQCTEGQGYLFSRPMPAEAFTLMLAA